MSVLDLVIGLVAPPECVSCGLEGRALCMACSASEIVVYGEHCWSCGAASPGGRTCLACRRPGSPHCVWVTTYYEGVAKKLLSVYKFAGLRAAAESLAELMAQTLEDFNDPADLAKLNYLIVPVPTATKRRRQRGFDHIELLAKHLAGITGLKTGDALGRLGQSRQVGAERSLRLKQAEDNYYVRLPHLVSGRNILLVDDVVTTGATLQAASKVLRQAGATNQTVHGGAKHVDALIFAKRL